MEIIVLLATIIAIIEIKRHSIADSLIKVGLPSLLIIPAIYSLHIPHLPTIGFADAALIPIAVALLGAYGRQWKLQRSDLWLALFVGGLYYAELQSTGSANAGLVLFSGITSAFFPYAIGKLLLEQEGVRERFVRRFVLLLVIVSVLSIWEFRMGTNLFTTIIGVLFPGQRPWLMQVRGGFVRIVGPFNGSILAGMILLVGLLFSSWLGFVDSTRGAEKKYFGIKQSTLFFGAIALGLFMTQSRGPWVGAILAYMIARIGRAKNMRRATIITLLLCTIGGTYGYIKVEQYTAGSIWDAKDIEQENAIYRRELLDNYKPIVEKGGFFGYGVVDWPRVPGQPSIDNEFLFLEITQGKLGFWTYVLLAAEAVLASLRAARRATQRTDVYFALCMLGCVLGLMLTLTTVYMGAQSYPLFFLLMGWSQSLRQTQTAAATVPEAAPARLRFRRVFA
jgi:O-Antigen ligase